MRDTGRGIPPQSMATLFEPFRRRQKAGEYAFSGSGLGLTLAREVVRLHGGDVTVESQLDKGSTFTIRLPALQEAA